MIMVFHMMSSLPKDLDDGAKFWNVLKQVANDMLWTRLCPLMLASGLHSIW